MIAEDWYFWSHRSNLAKSLRDSGFDVSIATRSGQYKDQFAEEGFHFEPIQMNRAGKNPLKELQTIWQLCQVMRRYQPDIVHLVGLKPILYGGLAARINRVPGTVCAVAGMGWLFLPGGPLKKLVRSGVQWFYRTMFRGRRDVQILVQNDDDKEFLCSQRMASDDQLTVINGSGVDTAKFPFSIEPDGTPVVTTHCRMLWDKGIGELVEAARIIKRNGHPCRFLLVGAPDPANPAAISEKQLQAWHNEGVIEWLGQRTDIAEILKDSHIACLPSYREGLPLSLIEAASVGRPIVATDVPGCREMVAEGQNGHLVPARNSEALAAAIEKLLSDRWQRIRMGRHSRQIVEQRMTKEIVNSKTLALYQRLLGAAWDTAPAVPAAAAKVSSKAA
ncbi:MAG: glycosyltransferase family 4 protein [Pirellulaceae bacterium]